MFTRNRIACRGLILLLLASGALAQEQAKIQAEKEPPALKGWGEVTLPEDVCSITADEGKLTIRVPGGLYDLNPAHEGTQAPRVLQQVDGNFTAQVKVTGDFDPGTEASGIRARPFNSGGLLLWQDSQTYIRLERNAWWVQETGSRACYTPLVEYFRSGEQQGTSPGAGSYDFFKGRSTWLKLARQGKKITASYSHDGKDWTVAQEFDADLAQKLRIGVAAINTATKPLVVEFAEFTVSK